MSLQNVFSTELMPFRMQNLIQIVQSQCPRMFTAKRNSAENFFQQQNCYLRLYKQVGPTPIQTNWYLRLYKQVGIYAYTNKLEPTPIQTNWYLRLYKQIGTYAYTNKLEPTPIQTNWYLRRSKAAHRRV